MSDEIMIHLLGVVCVLVMAAAIWNELKNEA